MTNSMIEFFKRNKFDGQKELTDEVLEVAFSFLSDWVENPITLKEQDARYLFESVTESFYGGEEIVMDIIAAGEGYPYEWLLLNDSLNKPVWQELKRRAILDEGAITNSPNLPKFAPSKNFQKWIENAFLFSNDKEVKTPSNMFFLNVVGLMDERLISVYKSEIIKHLNLDEKASSALISYQEDPFLYETLKTLMKEIIREEVKESIENIIDLNVLLRHLTSFIPLTESENKMLINIQEKRKNYDFKYLMDIIAAGEGYPYEWLLLNDSLNKPVWQELKRRAILDGGAITNSPNLPKFAPSKNFQKWIENAFPATIEEDQLFYLVKELAVTFSGE